MTAPAVRREILKLAIHAHLEPRILGTGPVRYELWCPGGLTEPAAKIFGEWPKGWTADTLQDDAGEVIGDYKKFKSLTWDAVSTSVTETFPQKVRPLVALPNVDITTKVRGCLSVYDTFFQGNVVMREDDVEASLRKIFVEVGYRELSDKDAKHVRDRVLAFPQDQRLVGFSGYVLGLPTKLVSRFNRKEFEEFAKHSVQATTGMLQVVLKCCSRLALEVAGEFRKSVNPSNSSITALVSKLCTFSMIARVHEAIAWGPGLQPGLDAYSLLGVRDRLLHHASQMWDEYQRCIAGYDPKVHSFASDAEFRRRIALIGLGGATSREAFEAALEAAIIEHLPEIEKRFHDYMALVPRELVVITDNLTAFKNPWLLERMQDTMKTLEALRGSPIIPE